VQRPIECTLTSEGAAERVDEWRRFMQESIDAAQVVGDDELRLLLNPRPDVLPKAVDLAQREKSCCRFFDFSIEIKEESCWLVVSVPHQAAAVLADFAGLLPKGISAAPQP
jgi:hypothetical protein